MSKKDKKPTEAADDTVGYGRPPKATQFKKGESGNPRGRPRKAEAAKPGPDHWGISLGALGRVAYEPVTVTLNGKQTKIPLIEAVHRRQINDALKGGNRLLQRDVIARADAHEQEEMTRAVADFLRLKELKANGEAAIAHARARGLPEPVLLPHPDDIVIDDEATFAHVDGPETRAQLAVTNHILALREHFVIRAAYQRRFPPLLRPFTEQDFEALRVSAGHMNDALCRRFRWAPYGFSAAMRPYEKKGYRFLEADFENSLAAIERTWANEPALEPLRRNKRFTKTMDKLFAFRTRRRERAARQHAYRQLLAVYRMAFGDQAVANMPKHLPVISYTEGMAIVAGQSPTARAMTETIVGGLMKSGSVADTG